MIRYFEMENKTTKKKYSFGQEPECDYIYKSDGVNWGSASAKHSTLSSPKKIGYDFSSTKITDRYISIIGYVFYKLTKEEREKLTRDERLEYGYEIIKQKKEKLNSLINPLDFLRITTGGYFIEGKPQKSIEYGDDESSNNEFFCKFSIVIYCSNPMFKKETKVLTLMASRNAVFHFPWILTQKYGIIMNTRRSYKTINVENEGDVIIGGSIIIEANGEVENPIINNITTGTSITINKTMSNKEKIVINTSEGKERGIFGYINDEKINYFKYWDFENDWIMFPVGTSKIEYYTTNGAEKMLNISIEINPEKFALEEM